MLELVPRLGRLLAVQSERESDAGADIRLSGAWNPSPVPLPLLGRGAPRSLACRRVGQRIRSCHPPVSVVLGSVEPEFEIEVCFGLMPAPAGLDAQLEGDGPGRAQFHLERAASQTEVLVLLNHPSLRRPSYGWEPIALAASGVEPTTTHTNSERQARMSHPLSS